jgi:hypothetical protein
MKGTKMRNHRPVIAVCLLICLAAAALGGMPAKADQSPIRLMKVTMAKTDREEFISRIGEFAGRFAFAIRIAQVSPNPEHIHVQMWRSDAYMNALNNSDTGAPDLTYVIGIFENGDHPITRPETDGLIDGLRETVGQIKGSKFLVTK